MFLCQTKSAKSAPIDCNLQNWLRCGPSSNDLCVFGSHSVIFTTLLSSLNNVPITSKWQTLWLNSFFKKWAHYTFSYFLTCILILNMDKISNNKVRYKVIPVGLKVRLQTELFLTTLSQALLFVPICPLYDVSQGGFSLWPSRLWEGDHLVCCSNLFVRGN